MDETQAKFRGCLGFVSFSAGNIGALGEFRLGVGDKGVWKSVGDLGISPHYYIATGVSARVKVAGSLGNIGWDVVRAKVLGCEQCPPYISTFLFYGGARLNSDGQCSRDIECSIDFNNSLEIVSLNLFGSPIQLSVLNIDVDLSLKTAPT